MAEPWGVEARRRVPATEAAAFGAHHMTVHDFIFTARYMFNVHHMTKLARTDENILHLVVKGTYV